MSTPDSRSASSTRSTTQPSTPGTACTRSPRCTSSVPAATPWRLEEVRALLQDTGSSAWSGGWAGLLGGEVVAVGWMRTPLLDNLELAELTVHVLPEHRRRGFGSAVLRRVEAAAQERGRRVLTGLAGWTYDAGSDGEGASGPGFARAAGYDLALSEVQRELRLPVDEELLGRLADEAARAHASYSLRSWVGPVPDDLLRGWAELTSTLVTEAPTGDLEIEQEAVDPAAIREREAVVERQGRTKYNTVALDAGRNGRRLLRPRHHRPRARPGLPVGHPGAPAGPGTPARGGREGRQPPAAAARAARHRAPDDVQRRGQRPHDRRQRGDGVRPGRAARGLPEAQSSPEPGCHPRVRVPLTSCGGLAPALTRTCGGRLR